MYYTSRNREELVAYNEAVNSGEVYNGTTMTWATIIEHPNGVDYAILKHENHTASISVLSSLSSDWFPIEE